MSNPDISAKDLEIQLESHIFTCYKYKDCADNGFSANLHLLLEVIEHSDKVLDENIKLIAKGILSSVMHHKIHMHNMDIENKNYEEWKMKRAENETKN